MSVAEQGAAAKALAAQTQQRIQEAKSAAAATEAARRARQR
ncbi:hypothetical protein [Streptomyces griseoflavus]|nr:hypothetical protein [Streptomyces griseoflavus]